MVSQTLSRRTTRRPPSTVQEPSFFDVLKGMRQGNMPSNAQILDAMTRIKQEMRLGPLSAPGQQVWLDAQRLMDTIQNLIKTKNQDELLQHMMYHSKLAVETQAKQVTVNPNDVMAGFHNLLLLLTRRELRSALFDLNSIFRELLDGFEVVGMKQEVSTSSTESEGKLAKGKQKKKKGKQPRRKSGQETPEFAQKIGRESPQNVGRESPELRSQMARHGPEKSRFEKSEYQGEKEHYSEQEDERDRAREVDLEKLEHMGKSPQFIEKVRQGYSSEPGSKTGTSEVHHDDSGRESREDFGEARERSDQGRERFGQGQKETRELFGQGQELIGQGQKEAGEPFDQGQGLIGQRREETREQMGHGQERMGQGQKQDETYERMGQGQKEARERMGQGQKRIGQGQKRMGQGQEEAREQIGQGQEFARQAHEHLDPGRNDPGRAQEKAGQGKESLQQAQEKLQTRGPRRQSVFQQEGESSRKQGQGESYQRQGHEFTRKQGRKSGQMTGESSKKSEKEQGYYESIEAMFDRESVSSEDFYLSDKQRLDLSSRLVDVIRRLESDPESRSFMTKTITGFRTSLDSMVSRGGKLPLDANAAQVTKDLQKMLGRFAGEDSMNQVEDSTTRFGRHVSSDPQLAEIVESFLMWFERCMGNPFYRDSEECVYRGANLIKDLRGHLYKHYRTDSAALTRSIDKFMAESREDPLAQELMDNVDMLSKDMTENVNGQVRLKEGLFRDFLLVVVPSLFEPFSTITVPPMTFEDDSWVVNLGSFNVQARNFMPDKLFLTMGHHLMIGVRDMADSDFSRSLVIHMNDIQPKMVDVPFDYRQKRGLLKLKDRGYASVQMKNRGGFDATIVLDIFPEDTETTFVPRKVTVDMGDILVDVHEAKHTLLYKYFGHFLYRRIRADLIQSIEKQLVESIGMLDDQVTRFKAQNLPPVAHLRGRELMVHQIDQFINSLGIGSFSRMATAIAPETQGTSLPEALGGLSGGW